MDIPILKDVSLMLGLSVVVLYFFQKARIPAVLGYLLTGVVVGPHGLSLVKYSHEVELLSEVGVILLLFIIGIEFSLKHLAAIKKVVLIGGTIQVGVTVIATALAHYYLIDQDIAKSVFLGFLFSLSSTAIVLKLVQEKGQMNSLHGNIILAILIFQDIIVVPMMLFTPMLSGESTDIAMDIVWLVVKVTCAIALLLVSARYIVPYILSAIAKTRSQELFIISVVVICFSVAYLTSSIGLSLALGAFMAGLTISESDYNHQAIAYILPFRELFMSFFFVSIGMLLNLAFFIDHVGYILLITLAVVLIKSAIADFAARLLHFPPKTAIRVGLSLFQIGEFSFILSKTGIQAGILDAETNQYFLAVSILSMCLTPLLLAQSDRIVAILNRTPLSNPIIRKKKEKEPDAPFDVSQARKLEDHLIIIGYGINGRNLARAAQMSGIEYVIIEFNARTVEEERAKGEHIIFGDASSEHILKHANVHKARVVVIAISDASATKKIVQTTRHIAPGSYILVRTRYVKEIDENLKLGANDVIPEEFETSVEIFTHVLTKYLVPADKISSFVKEIRQDNYNMFRPSFRPGRSIVETNLPGLTINSVRVKSYVKDVVDKTLSESNFRDKYNVTLLAIKKGEDIDTHIDGDTKIEMDDILYVTGQPEDISKVVKDMSK